MNWYVTFSSNYSRSATGPFRSAADAKKFAVERNQRGIRWEKDGPHWFLSDQGYYVTNASVGEIERQYGKIQDLHPAYRAQYKAPRQNPADDDAGGIRFKVTRKNRGKRFGGASVNATISKPTSPGWWVNETKCSICGRTYAKHRAPVGNRDALNLIRSVARSAGDDGGGYRSRGPMLWARRVLKLSHWFETHYGCGQGVPDNRREGLVFIRNELNAARRARLAAAAERRALAINEVTVYVEDPELGF